MFRSAVLRAVTGAFLAVGLFTTGASAQITASPRYSGFVIDARSGNVLIAEGADELRHPASLTKMMTLYMLFEAMQAGRITLSTPITVSFEAASRPPSKLGVPAGGSISAESAILALVTRSANDIATAIGETLGGDEQTFARMMTQRARSLGMSSTTFRNASGLPDPEQVTTARDMTLLGRRLIQDFPDRYHYFSLTHFQHGSRLIRNHNGMLRDYPGADGIKTGYINASGFNIVTSAQRDGVRLVGAVFGGNSWAQRNDRMAELLDAGFARMGVRPVAPLVAALPPRIAVRQDTTVSPAQRRAVASRQVAVREPAVRQRGGHARATATASRPAAARQVAARQAPARQAASRQTAATRQATVRPTAVRQPVVRQQQATRTRRAAAAAAPQARQVQQAAGRATTRAAQSTTLSPSRVAATGPRQQVARNRD
ncbi:D-alanyl-D-alanine carboxypeptidase family protein [Roseococcus pinisoli]|uniref:D-alanyl-D-alanine carboxypeptidase n=1 Tax=Roseococcus pinisoli TaxID=2835040 RepID=A0ABS5Q7S2_9PROT|nr:D-alanyl-D-alanine carboxypeptidase family protein [Roseococcus pinisoli]MBS7809686.1 D-alanyl-D-alanine carboxypeptidase [Roseococcus pinisoli]